MNHRLLISLVAVCGLCSCTTDKAGNVAENAASQEAVQELGSWLRSPREDRPPLTDAAFATVPLSREDAAAALNVLWQDHAAFIRETRAGEMRDKVIQLGELKMKFDWLSFTNAPATNGRSLFISMHGGGGAPKSVNDSQWRNQIQLGKSYKPSEGIYVAPRAPTDAWNLWHQTHIDQFFDRLIENFVVLENVNPNRVYILGYSAGGDGVYQLGPRMADRWAAASMMAGHPNEASPLGLRNVPFAIQVGGNDSAYKRNTVAAEWGQKLDDLQKADPTGYPHFTEIHAGKPHWMGLEDKKAIPWMEQHTRNPLPEKIVWRQDDVTHTRFYWLARPKEEVKRGQQIISERAGQTISLSSTNAQTVTVLLNDQMLNLDREVVIRVDSKELVSRRAPRTIATLARTLSERGDTNLAFSAETTVTLQ
jgi:poly(3-hydroxybutyrate) depolymerase